MAGQQGQGVGGREDVEVDHRSKAVIAATPGRQQRAGDRVGREQGLDLGAVEAVGEVVDNPQARLSRLRQLCRERPQNLIGAAVRDGQAQAGGDGPDLAILVGGQLSGVVGRSVSWLP
jgi:hypothetical protein